MPVDMANYMRERRTARLQQAREYLGGKCVVCGTIEDLDFDHIDPKTKDMEVSSAKCLDGPIERLMNEVRKCQLLCKPHHQEKTNLNRDNNSVDHGQGLSGKRNCACDKCKKRKKEYMDRYMETHVRKRDRDKHSGLAI